MLRAGLPRGGPHRTVPWGPSLQTHLWSLLQRACRSASQHGACSAGQDSASFMLGWCSGWIDGGKWSRIQKHLQPVRSTWPWTFQKSGSFFLMPCCQAPTGRWAPVASSCTLRALPFSRWEAKYRSAACRSSALWALHRHTHRERWWVMKTPREASLQTEKQTFILFSLQGVLKFEWLFETV